MNTEASLQWNRKRLRSRKVPLIKVLEVWILGTPDHGDCESFPLNPFKTGPTVLHYECPTCKKQAIKAYMCEFVETNYDACFNLNAFICTRKPQEFIVQGYNASVFV